ncbi:hypothetical protein OS493_018198, partial [Desmophyllum pertusum]
MKEELQEYGIDVDGPVPEPDSDGQEDRNLLDIANPLSEDDFAELQRQINPLHQDNIYGIDVFISS